MRILCLSCEICESFTYCDTRSTRAVRATMGTRDTRAIWASWATRATNRAIRPTMANRATSATRVQGHQSHQDHQGHQDGSVDSGCQMLLENIWFLWSKTLRNEVDVTPMTHARTLFFSSNPLGLTQKRFICQFIVSLMHLWARSDWHAPTWSKINIFVSFVNLLYFGYFITCSGVPGMEYGCRACLPPFSVKKWTKCSEQTDWYGQNFTRESDMTKALELRKN